MRETETRRCPEHDGQQPDACLWCSAQARAVEEHRIAEGQQRLLGWLADQATQESADISV